MDEKPSRYWYPILMIIMCVRMVLQASISFRATPKAIHTIFSHFDAVKDQRIPSHKTVGRWLSRVGLYKLNLPKEQGDDWALILDYSVQIGALKCLVILGARLSKLRGKPLEFQDVEVLGIELHENADKHVICQALEAAQNKVGKVRMVCADDGTDLRGGIQLFCEKHGAERVFDTIHKIGTFLKRILNDHPQWQAFTQAAAEAKKKMQQTPAAHLMPPNQRTKSRFLNIDILTTWAVDALNIIDSPDHHDRALLEKHCGWLVNYRELIEQLKQFDLIGKHVRQHVREYGLSANTGQQVEALLDEAMRDVPFNEPACQYAGELIDFLTTQGSRVNPGETWIGSSEIIESLFGKLKFMEQHHHKGGFSSLVLAMAACVGSLEPSVIQAAMLETRNRDVEKWTKNWVGTTILAKRRRAFRKGRRYKNLKTQPKCAGTPLGQAAGF